MESLMVNNIIIITMTSIITTTLAKFTERLSIWLGDIIANIYFRFTKLFKKKKISEIVITSYTVENTYRTYNVIPLTYKAIIYYLYKSNISVDQLRETLQNERLNKRDMSEQSSYGYIVSSINEIVIDYDNDIRIISQTQTPKNNHNKGKTGTIMYDLHIYSTKLRTKQLLEKLNEWKYNFCEHLKKYVENGDLQYFSIKDEPKNSNMKDDKIDQDTNNNFSAGVTQWKSSILKSSKTFDNVFFAQKDLLLQKLNFFLDNEQFYRRIGIPYNFGILLHGEPGCGKTSCIKALANLTKRHVVEINLKQIKTCGQFVDIFTSEFINDLYIPTDKKIIILEDIDSMSDIILDRSHIDQENAKEKQIMDQLKPEHYFKLKMMNECNKKIQKYSNNDTLTLSCILNIIDGVYERHGSILIITTNYLDKLDKALIRPGRIDMQINFTKCTSTMIRDIIEFFYNKEIDTEIVFPGDTYTPAEIFNRCLTCETDMDDLIKNLNSDTKEFVVY